MAQVTAAGNVPSFLLPSVCYLLLSLIIIAGGVLIFFIATATSIDCTPLLFISDDGFVSDVSCLSSFLTGGSLLSTILGHLLFFLISNGFLFAVFDYFLSLIIGDGPLSAVFIGDSSYFVPLLAPKYYSKLALCLVHIVFFCSCHYISILFYLFCLLCFP